MKAVQKLLVYGKMSARSLVRRPSVKTIKAIIMYFPHWWKKLAHGRNSISDTVPWLAFEAIDFIRKMLKPEMVVFEYGSGGSTLFWSARVAKVISVEHDKIWFEKVSGEFLKNSTNNIEYILKEAEDDPPTVIKNYRNPEDYRSFDAQYANKNFKNYVGEIDRFPDESFDIIVVDGRARPSCISHSINKLKKGGYLILDNSEREYYLAPFTSVFSEWKIYRFYGPVPYSYNFSETTIMHKR